MREQRTKAQTSEKNKTKTKQKQKLQDNTYPLSPLPRPVDCKTTQKIVFQSLFYDNFTEISYIKKFITIFSDDRFSKFFSPALLREDISQTFQCKIFALDKDEPTYAARKKYYENQMAEELDAVDFFEKIRKQKKGNSKIQMKKLHFILTSEKRKWQLNLTIGNLLALNLLQ